MAIPKKNKQLKCIKTGIFERRLSLYSTAIVTGIGFLSDSSINLVRSKENRKTKQKESLRARSKSFAGEIGKLKGGVVKVGQIMAVLGENFLPPEVTESLHSLEDDTLEMEWPCIEDVLITQLGMEKLELLKINPIPIAAASIGQVHLAKIKATNETICLKIQYPGVADTIDSDLNTFTQILRLSRLVSFTKEFKEWLEEIRAMLKKEVDYDLEFETTNRFGNALKNDNRYVVPSVYEQFSTQRVLAISYEPGTRIDSNDVLSLSQERRNQIGKAFIELCWREVFDWGEMQTDPNFGNYFVRLGSNIETDKLILLDFGAVRMFPHETLIAGREIVEGAFLRDKTLIKRALIRLKSITEQTPDSVVDTLSNLAFLAIEPFANIEKHPPNPAFLTKQGEYRWATSDHAARTVLLATKSSITKHFFVPPKDFMFVARKLSGAYTVLSVIRAEIKGDDLLAPFLPHSDCQRLNKPI